MNTMNINSLIIESSECYSLGSFIDSKTQICDSLYKLIQDEPMEYLVRLGINGLQRVLRNRSFTTSVKIEQSIEEYKENNNPVLLFAKEIDESMILNEPTKNVYMKYHEFCMANGCTPVSNIEFSKQINKIFDYGQIIGI